MFEIFYEAIISMLSLRGLSFLAAGLLAALYLKLIASLFPTGCISNNTETITILVFTILSFGTGVISGIPEGIVFYLSGIIGTLLSCNIDIKYWMLSHERIANIAKVVVCIIGGIAIIAALVQLWFVCKSEGMWGMVSFAVIIAGICAAIIVYIVKSCCEAAYYKRLWENERKHVYLYIYNAATHETMLKTHGYGEMCEPGGYSKRILKESAEAEMNFLKSIPIPENDIVFKTHYVNDDWVYPTCQNLGAPDDKTA